jgi:repressor LexA
LIYSGELTDRQKEVLDYIRSFLRVNGFPPTRPEIRDHFGWASNNAATCHIEPLVKKGHIEIVPGIARGIRVL